jgi:hypothetical protein
VTDNAWVAVTRWLDIDAELLARLHKVGDEVSQLSLFQAAGAFTCQVCGRAKAAGAIEPASVVAVEDGGLTVLGLAHRSCAHLVGGVLDELSSLSPAGADAVAFFGRRTVAPAAVLVFEPVSRPVVPIGRHDRVDLYVSAHLNSGLVMADAPIAEVCPPSAPGWSVRVWHAQLIVEHVSLGVSYSQPVNAEVLDWWGAARSNGSCLLVTGVDLGLDSKTGDLGGMDRARRHGNLLVGVAAVR